MIISRKKIDGYREVVRLGRSVSEVEFMLGTLSIPGVQKIEQTHREKEFVIQYSEEQE